MAALHDDRRRSATGRNRSRINQWLLWLGLAASVGWMFYRHNAHLVPLLPFLLVLACPLMHLFGHGGHGGHGAQGRPTDRTDRPSNSERQDAGHAH